MVVCRMAWGQDGKMRMDDGGFFLAISLFNIQNMRRQFPFIFTAHSALKSNSRKGFWSGWNFSFC